MIAALGVFLLAVIAFGVVAIGGLFNRLCVAIERQNEHYGIAPTVTPEADPPS